MLGIGFGYGEAVRAAAERIGGTVGMWQVDKRCIVCESDKTRPEWAEALYQTPDYLDRRR